MNQLALELFELMQKRDSTDAEADTAVSHRDASSIKDSSHQQQEQREPVQVVILLIQLAALLAVLNSE